MLLWAAFVKLTGDHPAEAASRTALARLVGRARVPRALRLVAVVELVVGTSLVLPPMMLAEALATVALTAGFVGYLVVAQRLAPGSSCGCLGASPGTGISWRSILRAGLLLVAACVGLVGSTSWFAVVSGQPLAAASWLGSELLALVLLSQELDDRWLPTARRALGRVLPSQVLRRVGVPLWFTLEQLSESPAHRDVAALLENEVLEHWDEEGWRVVCLGARHDGRPATAAFAVPLLQYRPQDVRVAVVDEYTGTVVRRHGATAPSRRQRPTSRPR